MGVDGKGRGEFVWKFKSNINTVIDPLVQLEFSTLAAEQNMRGDGRMDRDNNIHIPTKYQLPLLMVPVVPGRSLVDALTGESPGFKFTTRHIH